jgi:ABC-2 type transport system permease protein
MNIIFLIIQREFLAKISNKSFVIMTFVSPLLFVAMALFVSYITVAPKSSNKIAINDATDLFANDLMKLNALATDFYFVDVSSDTQKNIEIALEHKDYTALLAIPNESDTKLLQHKIKYISNEPINRLMVEKIENTLNQSLTNLALIANKVDSSIVQKAQSKVELQIASTVATSGQSLLNSLKVVIGGGFGYLIMMFIVIYGNMVMRSVMEEKANRIVEIIISSIKPFQLMIGKIIGTALAGVLQFSIWVVLGFLFLNLSSFFIQTQDFSSSIPSLKTVLPDLKLYIDQIWNLPIASILSGFLVYFIGGYLLYSSFYAAIGAAVDSQTDSQQFMFPIVMPLVISVYLGFFSVINDPHSSLAVGLSLFPLSSPIVMVMRLPFGVPIGQLMLSVLILFSTFLLLVWVSAKIYSVGILMHGNKPTWKNLIQWLKIKDY